MDSNTSSPSSMQYYLTGMSATTSATNVSESLREGPGKSILNRLPKGRRQLCRGIYSHLPHCPKRLYRKEAGGGKDAILQANVSRVHSMDLEPYDPFRRGMDQAQWDLLSYRHLSQCTLTAYIAIQALRSIVGRTASLMLYSASHAVLHQSALPLCCPSSPSANRDLQVPH